MAFLHQRLVEVADMQPMYAQTLPKATFRAIGGPNYSLLGNRCRLSGQNLEWWLQ